MLSLIFYFNNDRLLKMRTCDLILNYFFQMKTGCLFIYLVETQFITQIIKQKP